VSQKYFLNANVTKNASLRKIYFETPPFPSTEDVLPSAGGVAGNKLRDAKFLTCQ
jgi:hypothetical protein